MLVADGAEAATQFLFVVVEDAAHFAGIFAVEMAASADVFAFAVEGIAADARIDIDRVKAASAGSG